MLTNLAAAIQFIGPTCQMLTALIAAAIGIITFRYTRRQSAMMLVNHNNCMANLVNSTIIQSQEARAALGQLQQPIVGCPDDAVLFIYLNYVHNTFRMRQIGAVSAQVWRDTLTSCVAMTAALRADQMEQLLGRGYEDGFRRELLGAHRQAERQRRPHLAAEALWPGLMKACMVGPRRPRRRGRLPTRRGLRGLSGAGRSGGLRRGRSYRRRARP